MIPVFAIHDRPDRTGSDVKDVAKLDCTQAAHSVKSIGVSDDSNGQVGQLMPTRAFTPLHRFIASLIVTVVFRAGSPGKICQTVNRSSERAVATIHPFGTQPDKSLKHEGANSPAVIFTIFSDNNMVGSLSGCGRRQLFRFSRFHRPNAAVLRSKIAGKSVDWFEHGSMCLLNQI